MKNTCIKCKKELIEGAGFCPYCGADNSGSPQKAEEISQAVMPKYCMLCGTGADLPVLLRANISSWEYCVS